MGAFRNQIKNASTYLALAVAFFIPFGIRPLIYMIALWAFAVVIRGKWVKNWHENMTNSEKRKFFLLFVIFYLINLISLIYSRDQKEGFKEIQVKFSILLIPVLFAVSEKWTEKKVKKLFLAFVAGVIIASFVCYINAMLHSLQWADGKIIFSVHPPKSPWNSYFSYSDFSFMLHPSYFAMYICFVLMFLLDTYSSNKVNIICINKYLSFIAPVIHEDVKDYFNYSIVQSKSKGYEVNLKPYPLNEFVKTTLKKENFIDMEKYTKNVFKEFRENLN